MFKVSSKILTALLAVYCVNSTLKSAVFSYTDATKAENLHIQIHGTTKSGKKWKGISINDAEDAALELYKLFGNAQVMKTYDTHTVKTQNDANTRVNMWVKRLSNGLPTGGLLIYSDHEEDKDVSMKKGTLIGFMVLGASTVPNHAELAGAILPQYQHQGYGTSIASKFVELAQEIREIGLGPQVSISKFTDTEKDNDLNKTIAAKFCESFEGKPLEGIYTTCSAIQENLSQSLSKQFSPHYYTNKPIITIDTRSNNSTDQIESNTAEYVYPEFIQWLEKTLPSGKQYQSIYMPNGDLRVITRNDAGILKFAYNYPLSERAKQNIAEVKPFKSLHAPTNIKSA